MTSRRSRLKAVTNLPIRRKTLTTPGNGNESAASDNLKLEKVYSGALKDEEISTTPKYGHPHHVEEKHVNDIQTKTSESSVPLTCGDNFQNSENCPEEIVISRTDERNNSKSLDEADDLNVPSNIQNKNNNSSVLYRSNKRFKPNFITLSTRDRGQVQTLEKRKQNENSAELNCITISNSNYNNNNNNIIEDEFKCYTVLTPQNINLSSLSEYTITPLTPCSNSYTDATLNEIDTPQACKEVQIYTEIESTELFINNEINGDSETVIEAQSFEPVLTNLTICNTENNLNSPIPVGQNVNYIQPVLQNLDSKYVIKSNALNNIQNVFNGNNESYGNIVTETRGSDVLENTISSITLEYSDSSRKQSTSTTRRRRSKYNDFAKKLADAKREFQKKYEKTKPDRSTLKMFDLIFYNPATNPMESKQKLEKKDTPIPPPSGLISDLLDEEKVDEPESVDSSSKSNFSDNCDTENLNKMPVPQVKIGLDGEIILDEKSLVIETTDAKKGREGLQNSVPVFEDRGYKVSYYRGKSKKTRDWADFETKRFYKALNTIGPDFTLMQKYFPKRSRLELKNKFKREERLNRTLIDKALNNPSEFDMTQLEKDLAIEQEAEEVELEMRLCKIMKRAAKKKRSKTSFLSREIIETDEDTAESETDTFVSGKVSSEVEKNKKEKEFDFVFQKLLLKESEKSVSVLPEISSPSSNTFQFSDQGVT